MITTQNINNHIDNVISSHIVFRYQEELKVVKGSRREEIKQILSTYGVKYEDMSVGSKIDELHDFYTKESLKTRWTRLNIEQKQERIKSYCKENKINNELMEKYLEGMGKYQIEYDTSRGVVVSITPKAVKKNKKITE